MALTDVHINFVTLGRLDSLHAESLALSIFLLVGEPIAKRSGLACVEDEVRRYIAFPALMKYFLMTLQLKNED